MADKQHKGCCSDRDVDPDERKKVSRSYRTPTGRFTPQPESERRVRAVQRVEAGVISLVTSNGSHGPQTVGRHYGSRGPRRGVGEHRAALARD